jgi:hypothetical protein
MSASAKRGTSTMKYALTQMKSCGSEVRFATSYASQAAASSGTDAKKAGQLKPCLTRRDLLIGLFPGCRAHLAVRP